MSSRIPEPIKIGGIVPGLVLAFMLSAYVFIRVLISPELAPSSAELKFTWKERWASLKRIWHTAILIFLVLGSTLVRMVRGRGCGHGRHVGQV
jgi:TRAP-type mannitol/chloroaromatic compound transport system permease large subunit